MLESAGEASVAQSRLSLVLKLGNAGFVGLCVAVQQVGIKRPASRASGRGEKLDSLGRWVTATKRRGSGAWESLGPARVKRRA